MIDGVKKIGVSIILAGTFGVSANALCVLENYCDDVYLGVGGFHENMDANRANINRSAGFISIGIRDLFLKRVNIGSDIKVGYGNTHVSGESLNNFIKNEQFLYFELMPKIGLNLLKGDSPLFINLFVMSDAIISSSSRLMLYAGPEIEGMLKVTEKTKLTYSFGYGYVFGAGYVFDGSLSRINGYNQTFMFSLGAQTKISENVSFYIKGFGRYYDLNASTPISVKNGNTSNISIPKSNGWRAGLEAGFAF